MSKEYTPKTPLLYLGAPLLTAMLALSGCGGDDGNPGTPGEPGGEPAMNISKLNIEVKETALEEGITRVDYRVTNQDDEPVVGIPSGRFIAAQLLPEGSSGAGNSSEWQYFTAETCSSSCPGTYVDHKNGNYSYSFSAPFDGMNEIAEIAGATHRVVIKLGGDTLADGTALPVTNDHYDWQPPGGAPAYSRNIVSIDTCNSCHNDLAFHGGNYNQVETCVTCHNATRVSNPENIFPQMIHAKHLAGFPKPLSDCQTCHKEDETLSEQHNWFRVPTMESCGSCHNNIDFVKGEGHPAQADNSNCVACHNPDWTREVHANQENMAALEQFKAEVTNASVSGSSLSFSLKLSNPQTGAAYNDSADKQVFVNDLRVYANWGTSFDYATRSARSIRVHEVVPLSGSDGIYQYQLDGLTIPAGSEADAGTLAIQGRVCASQGMLVDCSDSAASVLVIKSSHQSFNMAGLTTAGRRQVVSNETCGSCHGDQQLNFHGARNDLSGQCQLCHNTNMQADATAANPSASSADFKQLIHALHSANFEGFETLQFPGNIGNCAHCHSKDENGVLSMALPLSPAVQPLSLDDGSFTSPTAAVCSNCHQSDSARNHMTQQGAVFQGTEADAKAGTESCATCHGQGGMADVTKVHPIAQ
ncbi:OmcA/MtrC family decaheme c-type cytochrome [Shewanella algae]|uniref:OmcA/MtrC family decaheme c-type cytochrome n=2 Tax=Shewanella TaxID=22 RepID=UPI001431595D|nr:OmcA/MtrC family decaheme c-type cytochrome [Shewanella sp. Iso12]